MRGSHIFVRTVWVYTVGGAKFVRTMPQLMGGKLALNLVADLMGATTWASDLADTVRGLVPKDTSGIFHHSDAGVAGWYDFAVALQKALAVGLLQDATPITPLPTNSYPIPATRLALSLLDCSKMRAPLEDGCTYWRTNLRTLLKEEAALG